MKAFNDREYLVQSTWGEELEKWANSYKNNVAIIEGAHKVTYKDLNEKVNTLAFGFLEMGLKKREIRQLFSCLIEAVLYIQSLPCLE